MTRVCAGLARHAFRAYLSNPATSSIYPRSSANPTQLSCGESARAHRARCEQPTVRCGFAGDSASLAPSSPLRSTSGRSVANTNGSTAGYATSMRPQHNSASTSRTMQRRKHGHSTHTLDTGGTLTRTGTCGTITIDPPLSSCTRTISQPVRHAPSYHIKLCTMSTAAHEFARMWPRTSPSDTLRISSTCTWWSTAPDSNTCITIDAATSR